MAGRSKAKAGAKKPKPERVYTDPGEAGLVESVLAVVTLCIFNAWVAILTILFILGLCGHRWALYTWLAIMSTLLIPGGEYNQWLLDGRLFRWWRRYFSFSWVFSDVSLLSGEGKYVFAEVPHGILPYGPLLAGTVANKVFEGWQVGAITASNALRVPGIKHMFSAMGAKAATKKNFLKILEKESCAVVVGGLAEMYMGGKGPTERVLLTRRKGFVKVALESAWAAAAAGSEDGDGDGDGDGDAGKKPKAGHDGRTPQLVPIYHFGLSQLNEAIGADNCRWSFLRWQGFSRKAKMAFMIVYGRWFTPTPFKVPIMMAVGRPVDVGEPVDPADKEAFAARVDEVHARFVEAMRETYEEHKEEYGWGDRPLVIE